MQKNSNLAADLRAVWVNIIVLVIAVLQKNDQIAHQPDSNLRVPKLFISPLLVFVIIFVVAGAIFRRGSELGLLLLLIWRRRVSLLGAAGNVGRGLGQTFHQVLAKHRAQKFAPPGHLRRPGQRVECLPSSARSPLQRPLIARPNKWAFS